jgi:phosphorylcholine metabolism protein LicD
MNKKIALENLIDLNEIFKKNGAEYWISCGTLLGLYRDGDFIGHDRDTDLCLNINSLNSTLINDILINDFEIGNIFGRFNDGFEIALHKNGVKTDLFLFYKNDNYWYHSVYSNFTQIDSLKYDYVFKPFELKETEFLGHKFITPDDIESVIIQQYGDDWRIPNKNWSYYTSPANLVKTDKRVLKSDTYNDFKKIINI